jgi:hypothetical protein
MSHRLRIAVLFLVLTASMALSSMAPCLTVLGDDPNSRGRTLPGKAA